MITKDMHWKKMVIICCSTLTALFSWLLLHTQVKENSLHPLPNKQSKQSNPYKNYVWLVDENYSMNLNLFTNSNHALEILIIQKVIIRFCCKTSI